MKLRNDLIMSWNLIHVLEDEPRKVAYYAHKMFVDYSFKCSCKALSHIMSPLNYANIVNSKQNLGIWRSDKAAISLYEIAKALEIKFFIPEGPSGEASKRIIDTYRSIVFLNRKHRKL